MFQEVLGSSLVAFVSSALFSGAFALIVGTWLNQKLEKTKSDLHKSTHISKAQFDREFEIYGEVWASLFEVKNATMKLRPMLDSYEAGKSKREVVVDRLNSDFVPPWNRFLETVEKYRPFYSEAVYSELQELLGLINTEAVSAELTGRDEYYREALESRRQIVDQVECCCSAIRERIEHVKVVE